MRLIRGLVRFSSVALLPLVFTAAVYHLTWYLGLPSRDGAILITMAFLAFLVRGEAECSIYLREVESITPAPIWSGTDFLGRLAILYGIVTTVSLSTYEIASYFDFKERLSLALLFGALSWLLFAWPLFSRNAAFIRGRKYLTFRQVLWISSWRNLWDRGPKIFFGGIWLSWSSAVKHWLILGITGVGKSMIIQLIMQSALMGRIRRGGEEGEEGKRDERGLAYDNKTELIPVLASMDVPYKILNPFDRRCVGWSLSADCPTHSHCLQISAVLMPQAENVGTDPFWTNAPRNLLAAVMYSFQLGLPEPSGTRKPIVWDFRDLVWAMQSTERIREIIERHPETRQKVSGCFDDPKLLASIHETIKSQMMFFEPVAACWHRAAEQISLTEAVRGEEPYVLVIGNDEELREAIDPINRCLIARYGQLALKRPKSSTRRIWFFLDEFPDLGGINRKVMEGLFTRGRSRGLCMVIGVQTLLSVVREYGRETAKVMLSQCQNLAMLGLGDGDDETTEWAARVIGQFERLEYQESETPEGLLSNGLGTKTTTSEQLVSRFAVTPSEFADSPETCKANGLVGYYRTRSIQGFWGTVLSGSFLERELLKPDESVPRIEEREHEEHRLLPWSDKDLGRLGLMSESELLAKKAEREKARLLFRGLKAEEFDLKESEPEEPDSDEPDEEDLDDAPDEEDLEAEAF